MIRNKTILIAGASSGIGRHGLKFMSVYPGFVATNRVQGDGIPAPFEISEVAAAKHIIYAIEKEKSDYAFPFVTASLVRLAQILPKAVTNRILTKLIKHS